MNANINADKFMIFSEHDLSLTISKFSNIFHTQTFKNVETIVSVYFNFLQNKH